MMFSTPSQNRQPVWPPSTQIYDYPQFNAAPNLGFAAAQLVLGCICVVLNSTQIALISATGYIAVGIWGGIPMTIAGVFGIAATKSKGKCEVMTTFIMSVVSAVLAAGVFACFAAGVAIDSAHFTQNWRAKIAVGVCIMVFGMSELVIAILQAVYCANATGIGQINPTPNHTTHNQQVLQHNQQQSQQQNQPIYTYVQGQLVQVGVMSQDAIMSTSHPSSGQQGATTNVTQFQHHLRGTSPPLDTSPPAYTATAAPESNDDMAGIHVRIF